MSRSWYSGFLLFVLAALIASILMVAYSKVKQADQPIIIQQKSSLRIGDFSQKDLSSSINDLNVRINNLDEKDVSVNKRFDDLYILGGTIVILLIAINVGIYVRTEDEVEKHFRENFDAHQKRILEYLAKSADAVSKIDANLAVSQTQKGSGNKPAAPKLN